MESINVESIKSIGQEVYNNLSQVIPKDNLIDDRLNAIEAEIESSWKTPFQPKSINQVIRNNKICTILQFTILVTIIILIKPTILKIDEAMTS